MIICVFSFLIVTKWESYVPMPDAASKAVISVWNLLYTGCCGLWHASSVAEKNPKKPRPLFFSATTNSAMEQVTAGTANAVYKRERIIIIKANKKEFKEKHAIYQQIVRYVCDQILLKKCASETRR
jgi:hypothetical protein